MTKAKKSRIRRTLHNLANNDVLYSMDMGKNYELQPSNSFMMLLNPTIHPSHEHTHAYIHAHIHA